MIKCKIQTSTNLFSVFTNLLEELKRCFRLLETDCFLLGFWSFDASENKRRRKNNAVTMRLTVCARVCARVCSSHSPMLLL